MELLANQFTVFGLSEAVRRIKAGTLPPRSACVTFDDGYADNVTTALPILRELNLIATFFIATGYLEGGRMWNDTVIESVRSVSGCTLDLAERGLGSYDISSMEGKRRALDTVIPLIKYLPPDRREAEAEYLKSIAGRSLPENLMMSREQVRLLSASGMEVGAHTVTHPILARIQPVEAKMEMQEAKESLESLLDKSIEFFAYPNGKPGADYMPEHTAMARELGFLGAVSTESGVAKRNTDLWQIPRFTPWDKAPASFFLRLLYNYRARNRTQ